MVDRNGARVGGVITDIFGVDGRRILDGLVQRLDRQTILDGPSGHVRRKLDRLGEALRMSLRDAERILLKDLLVDHDDLDRRLAVLDRRLHEGVVDHADPHRLLETIPGADRVSVTAFLVEASPDPVAVFSSAKHFAAWADGMLRQPRECRHPPRVRPRPRAKHLRTVLIGCAHGAARPRDCPFHADHKARLVRRGYKGAIVATDHKRARTVFAVRRDVQPYRDPGVDHEALVVQRNAPRWLVQLAEFGILEPPCDDGTMTVNWALSWLPPNGAREREAINRAARDRTAIAARGADPCRSRLPPSDAPALPLLRRALRDAVAISPDTFQ